MSIDDKNTDHMSTLYKRALEIKTIEELNAFTDGLTVDELVYLRTRASNYGKPVVQAKHKYLLFSLVNHAADSQMKLLQHALEKFMLRAAIEYIPPDAESYKSEMSGEFATCQKKYIVLHLVEKYKKENNIDQLYSIYSKMQGSEELCSELKLQGAKEVEINSNLSKEVIDEITELTKKELEIETTREEYIIRQQKYLRDFIVFFMLDSDSGIKLTPLKFNRNFKRYFDANYDELKKETESRFKLTFGVDHSIIPLESFDTLEECERYKSLYGPEFDLDVLCAEFNKFNIVAPVRENQSKIEFYDENKSILKEMIDSCQSDVKLGRQFMYEKMKRGGCCSDLDKNPELKQYMESFDKMEYFSVKPIQELQKLVKSDESDPNLNEIEIDVNVIKPDLEDPILRGFAHRYRYVI